MPIKRFSFFFYIQSTRMTRAPFIVNKIRLQDNKNNNQTAAQLFVNKNKNFIVKLARRFPRQQSKTPSISSAIPLQRRIILHRIYFYHKKHTKKQKEITVSFVSSNYSKAFSLFINPNKNPISHRC